MLIAMGHSSGCGRLVAAQLELDLLDAHLVDVGAGVGLGGLGAHRHFGLVLLEAGKSGWCGTHLCIVCVYVPPVSVAMQIANNDGGLVGCTLGGVHLLTERSVDGRVDLEYAPSGVTWRLTCPTANALEP